MRMGRRRGREHRRIRKSTKRGRGVARVEKREEWDDEMKRSNEEVTGRVEDQERGRDDDGKREEGENIGI